MLSDSYSSITLSLSWTMKQNTGRVSLLLIIYSSINSENDQLLDIVGLKFLVLCFYFLPEIIPKYLCFGNFMYLKQYIIMNDRR